jgi:hypothetical protein
MAIFFNIPSELRSKHSAMQSYYWTSTNALWDFDAEQVPSLVPGVGMLTNAHTGLNSLQMQLPKQTYDLHRYRDPGAGAVTTYHDSPLPNSQIPLSVLYVTTTTISMSPLLMATSKGNKESTRQMIVMMQWIHVTVE